MRRRPFQTRGSALPSSGTSSKSSGGSAIRLPHCAWSPPSRTKLSPLDDAMTNMLLAGLCAAALSCAATPLWAQVPAGGGEIPLSGHIGADMANRFHAAMKDGKPHMVRITSSGGEDAPALAIAADIAR